MGSTSAPGTVYQRPDPARTAQEQVQRANVDPTPDRRGTPGGVKSGDVEKPRGDQ